MSLKKVFTLFGVLLVLSVCLVQAPPPEGEKVASSGAARASSETIAERVARVKREAMEEARRMVQRRKSAKSPLKGTSSNDLSESWLTPQDRSNSSSSDDAREADEAAFNEGVEQTRQFHARQEEDARLTSQYLQQKLKLEDLEEFERDDLTANFYKDKEKMPAVDVEMVSKPMIAEDHLEDLRKLLLEQQMAPELVDMTIEGFRGYLAEGRKQGISDAVLAKNMDDFLEFEMDVADGDYRDTSEMKVREESLSGVIDAMKTAMINNLDTVVLFDLKSLNLEDGDASKLVTLKDQQDLKSARGWADFSAKYEKAVQMIVNKFITQKFMQQLDQIGLSHDKRVTVMQALDQEAVNLLNNKSILGLEGSKKYLEYTTKLQEYFVEDPVGKTVDHRLLMSDDLERVVNEYRINMFEKAVRSKLEALGASGKVIDQALARFKNDFELDDITMTTSPDVVFRHVQSILIELSDVRLDDLKELEDQTDVSAGSDVSSNNASDDTVGHVVEAAVDHEEKVIDHLREQAVKVEEVLQEPTSSQTQKKEAERQARDLALVADSGTTLLNRVEAAHPAEVKALGWYDKIMTQQNMLKALSVGLKAASLGLVGYGIYKGISTLSADAASAATQGGVASVTGGVSTISSSPISSVVAAPQGVNLEGMTNVAPSHEGFFKEHNVIPTDYRDLAALFMGRGK